MREPSATSRNTLSLGFGAPLGIQSVGPNPSRGPSRISFTLGRVEPVQLGVFDARGRQVADLVGTRAFNAGPQTVTWDGRADAGGLAPPGMYFVRLRTSEGEWNQAVIRLR